MKRTTAQQIAVNRICMDMGYQTFGPITMDGPALHMTVRAKLNPSQAIRLVIDPKGGWHRATR